MPPRIQIISIFLLKDSLAFKDFGTNFNTSLFDSSSKTQKSVQPMSSLFDQALHIYGDIVSLGIWWSTLIIE